MKKFTMIAMAIILTLVLCTTMIPVAKVDAKSKNIYFAGEYRKKNGKGEYYILKMNQYSSPEGKTVGNYEIYYYYKSSGGMNLWSNGEIKKVAKNQYKCGKIKFNVSKKKVVVKKANDLNGSYKLKKRYPRP